MTKRLAIIAGTGMDRLSKAISASETSSVRSDTPWGQVPITILNVDGCEVFLVDRHHSDNPGFRTPPHEIEHRAVVHALRSANPDLIVSVNSVGTMTESLPPGQVGVVTDVLDLSSKAITFHESDAVHADRTNSFSGRHISLLENADIDGLVILTRLVSAQCVGPQFETPAEIRALSLMGADVVGMTLGPESRLISETEIPHLAICCSSNWAAGLTPGDSSAPIDHQQVEALADSIRSIVANCVLTLVEG
ncbi:MAG: hypothetical protein CMA31_06785 [Euryarchaeota archaeon]|nr:hypothetical protein [Euryarchaeota archaeon]|tara:strand:- start:2595 stop:3344 length:750 start_codon:yes stop_codon:yes gene_type:complete